MKVIVAPDSFKGSLTAAEVCAAIAEGIRTAAPDAEVISVPMADGGEGTTQSLVDALGGEFVRCEVTDPLGRSITAQYGIVNGFAVMEMAQASGLPLLSEDERDPLLTSTYGTGLMILDALKRAIRDFILGIGGSTTNDGGAGMAQALGYQFLDAEENELAQGGGALLDLAKIDVSGVNLMVYESHFTVACDVDNPLLGERGASAVFGPQKGATPEKVALLDEALSKLSVRFKEDLEKDVAEIPGAGAAGGLGAGSIAFLGATLEKGVDIVIRAVGLEEKIKNADLVITGEGRTDRQTLGGKTVSGVAQLAQKYGKSVILISGSVSSGAEELYEHGVKRMYQIMEDGVTLEEAIQNGAELLAKRAERAIKEFEDFK